MDATNIKDKQVSNTYIPIEKVEAKKESASTSKSREVLNFAKDVTLIVGATFGTLLLINYVGEGVQGFGNNLMRWAANVVNNTDLKTEPHCFRFANYRNCIQEKDMAPQVYEMGVLISRIGSSLESGSALYLNAISAPFYSAYHVSGDVFNQISSFVTGNLCALVCDRTHQTFETGEPLVIVAEKYIQNSYESTIDSLNSVYQNALDGLNKLPSLIPSYQRGTSYSKVWGPS